MIHRIFQNFYNLIATPNKLRLKKFAIVEDKKRNANKLNLRNFEEKIYSQNGEDGIIQEIFKRIGTTNKFFVEFGIQTGEECNTRNLLENHGRKGVWIDGDEEFIKTSKKYFENMNGKYELEIVKAFITKDNIESLFLDAKVPLELDLLSIDIDGNDFWIWKEIKRYNPRLVIIEYNGKCLPNTSWEMPYNEGHIRDGSNYFGASLKSLNTLGSEKGYTLVGCNSTGLNAFFVRNDLLNHKFDIDKKDNVGHNYVAPKYVKLFFGHPPRILQKIYNFFGLQKFFKKVKNK